MAIITIPAGMYFGAYSLSQKRFDMREMSDSTGDTRDRLRSPPRWRLRIAPAGAGMTYEQADLWKGMVLSLRGGINHFAAYDVVHTRPKGTCAGTLTVGVNMIKGATSVTLAGGTPGTTLGSGDWLQLGTGLGSMYVSVVAGGTFSGLGAMTITFEPPSRIALSIGAVVTYDKPVAYYKMMTDAPEWGYMAGAYLMSGFSLDFMEHWV